MENYYRGRDQFEDENLQDLKMQIPQWAKTLVELYTSPLKYQLKYELLEPEPKSRN